MKRIAWIFAVIMLADICCADVLINQVYYDPAVESGGEAVEIYNNGNFGIDISGWVVKTETSDTDVTIPENTTICAGCFYLIADEGWSDMKDNASWPDADYEESITMYNSDSGIALMDNATVIDAVGWGDETQISESLFEGSPCLVVSEGYALVRAENTNNNSYDFTESWPDFGVSLLGENNNLEINLDVQAQTECEPSIEVSADFSTLEIMAGANITVDINVDNTGECDVDLGVSASDLTASGSRITPSNMVVIYDEQETALSYGLQTLRIGLEAGNDEDLRLNIVVPDTAIQGSYTGEVQVIGFEAQ